MTKVHTISIDDFIKDPIVEKVVASSTGPVFKKLVIRTNVLNKIVIYDVEYRDCTISHPTLRSAIETYNIK
jgi:hypothetical protein